MAIETHVDVGPLDRTQPHVSGSTADCDDLVEVDPNRLTVGEGELDHRHCITLWLTSHRLDVEQCRRAVGLRELTRSPIWLARCYNPRDVPAALAQLNVKPIH